MNRADRFNGKSSADKLNAVSSVSTVASTTESPGAPASCGIAFMAKASSPGHAKTRLVPPLNFEEAALLNTAFLQDVADNVLLAGRRSAAVVHIVGYAAYGPAGTEDFFRRALPDTIGLIGAWQPDFGDCLFQTICEIFARGHGMAVVLNSDSPTLPTALLIETAIQLAKPGDRAVLGPSTDGGYYLLGLKAAHRRMFEDITWSTDAVAEQTRQRAYEIGLELHTLPTWYDVDDVDGLCRLSAELSSGEPERRPDGHFPRYAVQTARLMARLCRDHDFGRRIGRVLQVDEMRA